MNEYPDDLSIAVPVHNDWPSVAVPLARIDARNLRRRLGPDGDVILQAPLLQRARRA